METTQASFSFLLTLMGEFRSLSAMADLQSSIVLGCNFLSWKKYGMLSAMDLKSGVLKST